MKNDRMPFWSHLAQTFLLVLCSSVLAILRPDITFWSWISPVSYALIMGVSYIPIGLYLRWRNMRRDWLKYHLMRENLESFTVALVLLLMILLDTNAPGSTLWEKRFAMIGLCVVSIYLYVLVSEKLEIRFRPKDS